MAGQFGYTGKILRVDLSRGHVSKSPTSDYASRFLGGRGIAAKLYWDEVPPETKAFDPENKIIFITGPLAAFPGFAASRWQICAKSPVTTPGFFSYASLGGSWGAFLKFAGYDGIVIQGKADKPVYLFIHDGNVDVKEASFLWGKSTVETQEILRVIHGRDTRVVATGPAGENLASMAIVFASDDAAGSAGFGAVMGSKKIKAIAVKGSGKVVAANSERLAQLRKYVRQLRREAPTMYIGGHHDPFWEGNPKLRKVACWGCSSGCDRSIYEANDGKKGKFMCQAPYLYRDFARRYYGEENDVAFYAARLCDEYGLDAVSIRVLIKWLWWCFQAGMLDDKNTGIPLSKLGSLEFIETLVRKVSLREGFGDILAQGIFKAVDVVGGKEQLGGDIWKTGYPYYYQPRLYIMTGMLYVTEPRTPNSQLHDVSLIIHEWLDWYNKVEGAFLTTEAVRAIAKKLYGSEITFDFSTYDGKALAAKKIQDREYAKECLVLCDFSWPMRYLKHTQNHIGDSTVESQILSAVTGKDINEEGLCQIGERVFNLQRAILVREGHKGREDDKLPETDYNSPVKVEMGNPEGLLPGKGGEIISRMGAVIDRESFEKVKDQYYQLRGWDRRTGLQTKMKLEELELDDIAKELATRGLLVG